MDPTIDFPDQWVDLRLGRDRWKNRQLVSRLRGELRRELSPEHPLSISKWTVIGCGAPSRDDVLIRLKDGSVAITHLTWNRDPERLLRPTTVRVTSRDQFHEELIDRGYDISG
jgi:hypothetical protein